MSADRTSVDGTAAGGAKKGRGVAEESGLGLVKTAKSLSSALPDLLVVALGDAAEKLREDAKEILAPVAAKAGRPLPES